MRTRVTVLVLAAGALPAGGDALAAGGVTPLSPAAGATLPVGRPATFRMRVHGRGEVHVRVCRSRRRNRSGVICAAEDLGRARRGAGGVSVYRARVYDLPSYWLERRGTYYWQAYRIQCSRLSDCLRPGPVRRVRVG
jgi:hypothetical protein